MIGWVSVGHVGGGRLPSSHRDPATENGGVKQSKSPHIFNTLVDEAVI